MVDNVVHREASVWLRRPPMWEQRRVWPHVQFGTVGHRAQHGASSNLFTQSIGMAPKFGPPLPLSELSPPFPSPAPCTALPGFAPDHPLAGLTRFTGIARSPPGFGREEGTTALIAEAVEGQR